VIPDGESARREQLLDLRDRRNEVVGCLSAVEERDERLVQLVRDHVDEEAHACTLDRVLWKQARVGVQVCDKLEQDQGLGELVGFRGRVLRVRLGGSVHESRDLLM